MMNFKLLLKKISQRLLFYYADHPLFKILRVPCIVSFFPLNADSIKTVLASILHMQLMKFPIKIWPVIFLIHIN